MEKIKSYVKTRGLLRVINRFFEKTVIFRIGKIIYNKIIPDNSVITVNLKSGLKMALPTEDQGLSRDLFIFGIREENALNFYLKNLRNSDVVIDCGSNLGYFAIHAAQKTSFVYAIEPLKIGVHFIGVNFFLNNLKNFKLFNFAVGKKSKKETNFIKSNSFNTSRLLTKNDYRIKNLKVTKVPIKKIDDFIKENNIKANVLRMDVEGQELNILKGAENFLKQKKLLLFIEIHPYELKKEGVQEFFKIIEENNFRKIFIDNFNKKFKKNYYFEKISLKEAIKINKNKTNKKGIVYRMFFIK